jgi:N-acetylglucosamine-6-phosphate deacetylase
MKTVLKNFVYFVNGQSVKDKSLIIEGDIITAVLSNQDKDQYAKIIDLEGNYLVPGFVDLQVNGGKDVFFSNEITEETIERIYSNHLKFGTTCILPTLISTSLSNILKAIEVVRAYMQHKQGVAGLHIEGPFLNLNKKGAHNPKYIRKPDEEELRSILDAGEGVIKMMTIAPEMFSDEQIKMIGSRNITISAGHSNVSSRLAKIYFSKGINCVTHLFNAMSQFDSREPGLVGATLDSDVYAGIIVDGVHCDYTSVRIAHKLKKGRLFLVSDSTLIGIKSLEMDGIKFIYSGTGFVNSQGNLAGSNITMSDAVRNCVNNVGISLADAIKMASEIPLEVIGLSGNRGKIEPGYKADIAILSKDNLRVREVIANGEYLAFNN